MTPLITRQEALDLGELEDRAAIEALIERAWQARSRGLVTEAAGDLTQPQRPRRVGRPRTIMLPGTLGVGLRRARGRSPAAQYRRVSVRTSVIVT